MKFETLNKYNIKYFLIIMLIIIVLLTTIMLIVTKAKYQVTESIPLANGTINYTLVDFELAGIKFKANGSQNYADVETIEDNYVLNENDSYCTEKYTSEDDSFADIKNEELTIEFDNSTKTISVKPYSKKGTKCYLFFDEKVITSADTLAKLKIEETNGTIEKINGPSCNSATLYCGNIPSNMKQNGIYEAEDDYGLSYFYRGTVNNNWLVFGKEGDNYIWWRIIRINGNGSIRLIYAVTSADTETAPSTIGNGTMIKPKTQISYNEQIERSVLFNERSDDNKYVGYMYNDSPEYSTTFDEAHKITSKSSKSKVLEEIEYWYNTNTNLKNLATKYIDIETGFCSDTTIATGNHGYTGQGFGREGTTYSGYNRAGDIYNTTEPKPSFMCPNALRDLYTGPNATSGNNALPVPVGLITMDEVIYAGGYINLQNGSYWLYNNRYFWTITPTEFNYSNIHAYVATVRENGELCWDNVDYGAVGIRPVINLKADVTFEADGTGTSTNPYIA